MSVNGQRAKHNWGAVFEVSSMPGSSYTLDITSADGASVRPECLPQGLDFLEAGLRLSLTWGGGVETCQAGWNEV